MKHCKLVVICLSFLGMMDNAVAATAIDLRYQSINSVRKIFAKHPGLSGAFQSHFKLLRSDIDFNQTAHIRFQQIFAGIPIWGAYSIMHVPHTNAINSSHQANINKATAINGIYYEGIEKDLANTSRFQLDATQKMKVLEVAKQAYEQKTHHINLSYQQESTEVIIFVDENKANYAYLVSFFVDDGKTGPHRPTMIIDAAQLRIYRSWDQIVNFNSTLVGGVGGNEKAGQIVYDGLNGHRPPLLMEKKEEECVLKNNDTVVVNAARHDEVISGKCLLSPLHNHLPWLSLDDKGTRWYADQANGGYSPSLDAFYGVAMVRNLFQEWYGKPMLTAQDGKTPLKITIQVHYGENFGDANWDEYTNRLYLGDGDENMHPLSTLDVIGHELGHAFLLNSVALPWTPSNAALYEAFADMTAAATQFYFSQKNDWKIGHNVMKHQDAMRYMDDPKKDGKSIDNINDPKFSDDLDKHYSCGVYNKAFYLIATSPGWNTKKAFNIMVKAAMHYWTTVATFEDTACGVLSATDDYHYNVEDVKSAFANVGIKIGKC